MRMFVAINFMMGRLLGYRDFGYAKQEFQDIYIASQEHSFKSLLKNVGLNDKNVRPKKVSHDKLYKIRPSLDYLSTVQNINHYKIMMSSS